MFLNSWKNRTVALLAAVMTFACGQVEGPEYEGEALATLKGQLTSNGTFPGNGQIRLALAWYPQLGDESQGAPKGILTEDVVYQGSFPLNYTFNVTKPPPPAAISDMSEGGGPRKAAMGMLLAYEDLNGNNQLDTIPAAGQPVDKVLGTSADWLEGRGFFVIWQEEAAVAGDALAQSLGQGFNLVQLTPNASGGEAKVVPLSTSIVIALESDPWLNVYVCEALFTPSSEGSGNQLPCGLEFPGEDPSQQGVSGNISLDDYGASAWINVMENGQPRKDVTVTLNETPLNHDGTGTYSIFDSTGALVKAGQMNTLKVVVPGQAAPVTHSVMVPGDFAILSPSIGSVVSSGQPFTTTWSQSSGADSYQVVVQPLDFSAETIAMETVPGSSTSFTTAGAVNYVGDATVLITAEGPLTLGVNAWVSRSLSVKFE